MVKEAAAAAAAETDAVEAAGAAAIDLTETACPDKKYKVQRESMSFRRRTVITVMVITITGILYSQTDGEKVGLVRDIDKKTSEIIVGSSNAADDIKMGDLLYVRIDGKIIKLRATFPMQTVAKCKAEGKNRALWKKIEKGMAVYRYTDGIEEVKPGTDNNKTYNIGDRGPAGGWIFYDKGYSSDGWRYLEAAPDDLGGKMQWYNGSSYVTGAAGQAIGDGRTNTRMIVEAQGEGGYAAKICADYRLGGKKDWFLPSKNELNEMIINLQGAGVGGFEVSGGYWSSSEYSASEAWAQHTRGGLFNFHKSNDVRVRAVRAF